MRISMPIVSTTTEAKAPAAPLSAPAAPARVASRPPQAKRGWRQVDAPPTPEVAEVGGRFLYVAEQGTMVRRSGSRLIITRKTERLLDVSAVRLQGVVLYGNVQMSSQCFRALMSDDVWVSLFSRGGQYRGRMQPPLERGGRLRRRQWERAEDPEFCLGLAKAVVRGKVLGALKMAEWYAKNRLAESLGTAHLTLRECVARVDQAAELSSLRGVEGTAGRAYFDLFGRWNVSDLAFPGREKRGTTNPLNALLNFGYALLLRELEGLLEAAGLDPTIGFYHQPDDDRPSLACDWIEEFRHLVVDRLVLTLVNRGSITSLHFEQGQDHRGVRMTTDGLRVFSAAWERMMRRPFALDDGAAANAAGLRHVLLRQLARMMDALAGREPYISAVEAPQQMPAAE